MSWRARLAAWPGLAFFRLRLFFRGVFLLLALATVAIALSVLQDEKELSHRWQERAWQTSRTVS